jgi:hypothetical protein
MTKAGDRILAGAKEALSFARGECDHEWVFIALGEVATTANFRTKQCQKCGVKITRAVPNGDNQ